MKQDREQDCSIVSKICFRLMPPTLLVGAWLLVNSGWYAYLVMPSTGLIQTIFGGRSPITGSKLKLNPVK